MMLTMLTRMLAKTLSRCQNADTDAVPFTTSFDECQRQSTTFRVIIIVYHEYKSLIWFSFSPASSCHGDAATFLQPAAGSPVFPKCFFQVFFLRLASLSYRGLVCHEQPYLYMYTFDMFLFHSYFRLFHSRI